MQIILKKKKNEKKKDSLRAIRMFSKINDSKFSKVLPFYANLLKIDGIFLEEAINKKPIANLMNRTPLTSIEMIEKVLEIPNRDIQISFGSSNLIVFDFDFHKSSNENEREIIKKKVLELAKDYNITTVSSKSGGLHLYLNSFDNEIKTSIGITLACFIPMVDVCSGKIIGPNFKDREILAFCGFETKIPKIFLPLSLKESKILNDKKPHKSFVECWNKGNRKKSLISLLSIKYLSKDMILQINDKIFNPPMSQVEIQAEVLDIMDSIYIKNEFNERLYEDESIKNIRFDPITNKFFLWNILKNIYEKIEIRDVFDLIKEVVTFENFEKYSKKYLYQIKEYNSFSNLKKESGFEFLNASFNMKEKKLIKITDEKIRDRHPNSLNFNLNIDSFNKNNIIIKEDILSVMEEIAPQHFNFIMGLFSNFKKETQKDFSRLIFDLCFLVFLKNSESFKDFCPKKILWFYGPGGTGKSQLIDFISSFLTEDKVTASDFSFLTKNFEMGGWMDKSLVLFNDESLSSKHKNLDDKVSSIIKKICGGDLIRVEEKFKMVQSKKLNLFMFCSMNYQFNSGDTTNFVAMNRRAIRIPLLNFVKPNKRVDNFSDSLPKKEKSSIMEYFLKNLDKFETIFNKFNSYNVDHIFLINQEKSYYNLIDPIFAFLSLKCDYRKVEEKISFYKFYAEYIKYHFLDYDPLISVEDFDIFLDKIEMVIKDSFNTEKFNELTSIVSKVSTNLQMLDPLLHLPILSQNTFMSFFAIIESRLPFILEDIDLNAVKLVSEIGTYKKKESKKNTQIRLLCIQGIQFLEKDKNNSLFRKKENFIIENNENLIIENNENFIIETNENLIIETNENLIIENNENFIIKKNCKKDRDLEIFNLYKLSGFKNKDLMVKFNIKKSQFFRIIKKMDNLFKKEKPS